MSTKEMVIEAVRRMPDEATLGEIVQHLRELEQQQLEHLKSLLREGMQSEPITMTPADWEEMRRQYDKEFPVAEQS